MNNKRKQMGIVDGESGEVQWALVPVRQKHLGGFFMGIQDGFIYLAKMNLPQEQSRILHFLFGKLDFENWLRISQTEIAEELEMKRANVSRAIKGLVDKGILHKGPKIGTSWTYRLDPSFGYKGKASKKKALEEEIRKRGLEVIEGGQE